MNDWTHKLIYVIVYQYLRITVLLNMTEKLKLHNGNDSNKGIRKRKTVAWHMEMIYWIINMNPK